MAYKEVWSVVVGEIVATAEREPDNFVDACVSVCRSNLLHHATCPL